MKAQRLLSSLMAASFTLLSTAPRALAQNVPSERTQLQEPRPVDLLITRRSRPNRVLLLGSALTFAASYGPSVGVAVNSGQTSDKLLFAPFAGPWLDLAGRSNCGTPGASTCDVEHGYQALLVAAGVAQALSIAELVAAFMIPEQRTQRVTSPVLGLAPMVSGAAYGLRAAGQF